MSISQTGRAKPFYLRQRPDRGNKWYVSYYHGGEQSSWKCCGTTSQKEAEAWAEANNPAKPNWGVYHSDRSKLKAAARAYAQSLPDPAVVPHIKFGQYAHGWFEPTHEWVKRQAARGHELSPLYLDKCRGTLMKHVLPKWRLWALEDITPGVIDDWLMELRQRPARKGNKEKGRPPAPLSSSRVNGCLSVMRVMLRYAARKGYIKTSPAADCERMVGGGRARGILAPAEVKVLFDERNIQKLWGGKIPLFCINLLGASTGMRCGECQGLQVKHVWLDNSIPHIEVRHSWHGKHGMGKTKTTGSVRDIPVPALTIKYLRIVIEGKGPEDLVFPGDSEYHTHGRRFDQMPLDNKTINEALRSAMHAAEIDDYNGRAGARWITFHSHRHYYVSVMSGKMPEHLLRALTGHTTAFMTAHYTHVGLSDVASAAGIQDKILAT
jgi:integrase